MRKFVLLLALAAQLALPAAAQNRGRFTLGGQFVSLFTNPGGACQCPYDGGGAAFTARLVGRLGVFAEADFLPGGNTRFTEFFAGPRLRVDSSRRLTFYLTLGPGEIWQSSVQHFLAFGLGGTFELRLSRRWLGRLEVGDEWIPNPACSGCIGGVNLLPSHNPQASLGFAYRF